MRGNFLILWKLETIYGKSDNKLKSVTADLGKRCITSTSVDVVAMILYKKVRLHMQL